jgi:hypothetical protein
LPFGRLNNPVKPNVMAGEAFLHSDAELGQSFGKPASLLNQQIQLGI